MKTPTVIQRYGKPGHLDTVACGTLCRVINSTDETFEIYKQMSEDEENPVWELQNPLQCPSESLHSVIPAYGDLKNLQ